MKSRNFLGFEDVYSMTLLSFVIDTCLELADPLAQRYYISSAAFNSASQVRTAMGTNGVGRKTIPSSLQLLK